MHDPVDGQIAMIDESRRAVNAPTICNRYLSIRGKFSRFDVAPPAPAAASRKCAAELTSPNAWAKLPSGAAAIGWFLGAPPAATAGPPGLPTEHAKVTCCAG
jgi:hypothetical protein